MDEKLTLGQKLADILAAGMGSWYFLIIQTIILAAWVLYNAFSDHAFDPYPFVFLNLVLSFQAAYSAPIIMMSGNRSAEIDRERQIAIFNLEQAETLTLETLILHLDDHFHKVNTRIDEIEQKITSQGTTP